MDAVLEKLGKKLGRKPLLKRKGMGMEPSKPSGMTVVIGMGSKPMGKPMDGRGPMRKRDDEPMDEMEPESMNAKLDALMERIDMLEAKLAEYEGEEESTDDEEEED